MTLTTIPYTRSFFRGSKQIMGVATAMPMKTYAIPHAAPGRDQI